MWEKLKQTNLHFSYLCDNVMEMTMVVVYKTYKHIFMMSYKRKKIKRQLEKNRDIQQYRVFKMVEKMF